MAIKISNTTVIDDSKNLSNIAGADATTVAALNAAGIGGGIKYTRKTANYTAVDKDGIIADTKAGSFTVTLPATPATGNQVSIVDGASWGTNNLTVARNGSTIEGAAEDLVLDISGAASHFIFDGTTWNVYAQVGATSGTAVTVDTIQTLTNKAVETSKFNTNIREKITVSATASTGTINLYVLDNQILYYTTNSSSNFVINITGNASNTLNSLMNTGESISVTFMCTNGATAYYNTSIQIDGVTTTANWQGGSAPTSGNASSIDSYSFNVIKTGTSTFKVLAAQTQFK